MPFGVVSGVGQGMGVLDWGWRSVKGKRHFLGECGASHCNQWGLCDIVCKSASVDRAVIWGVEWGGPRYWYTRWGSTWPKGKGRFWGFSPNWFEWRFSLYF